jgi:opacity protein-like surface antigen
MKKHLVLLVCMCVSHVLLSQSNTTVSYVIGFPSGDLGGFIDKTSWRGFSLDYRYMFQPNIALGMNVSWTTFYEERNAATYTSENASLYGKQFRYSNNVPILATVTYFSAPEAATNPFVSLGVGTMYSRRNTDMNLYTVEQDAWNFVLQPEIGVQLHLSEGVALAISGKYNYGFAAGDLEEAQSYFALHVGFAFF